MLFASLPDKKYDIIYADPPWNYKGQKQHGGKKKSKKKDVTTGGAATHYDTITLDQLKTLDVSSIAAKNCLLYMWTSSPHLDQAIELMRQWGFKYVTVAFVWYKKKTNPGYYTLSECELCIVGKRGKIPTPRGSRKERQLIEALRGEHSEKPDEAALRIHRMHPTQNKIELFARKLRDNFDVWGREAPNQEKAHGEDHCIESMGNSETPALPATECDSNREYGHPGSSSDSRVVD